MALPAQQLPEVGIRPSGAPQINLDTRGAFGEAVGEGLQQASRGAENLASAMAESKQKADHTWTLNAENEWHSIASQMSSQVMNAQGQDAAAISADRTDKIRKAREKIIASANNPQQAEMFRLRTSQAQDQYERQMEGHVAQQTNIAVAKSADALADGSLSRIAQNYANPELIATMQAEAESGLRAATRQYGQSYSDQVVNAYREKSAKVVMNGFLGDEDAQGAKNAYAVLKDQLGADAPQYEHHVKLLERQQGALSDARAIISAPDAYLPGTKILNVDLAMKKFQALPTNDPQRLDQTRRLLNDELQMSHAANEQGNASAFNRLLTAFQRGAPMPVADQAYLLNANNVNGGLLYEHYLNIIRSQDEHKRNQPPTPEQDTAFGQALWDIYSKPGIYAQFDRVDDFHSANFNGKGPLAAQVTPKQLEHLDNMLAGIKGEVVSVEKKPLPPDLMGVVHKELADASLMPKTKGAPPSQKQQAYWAYVVDDVRQKYIAWKETPENAKSTPSMELVQSWIQPHIQKGVVLDTGAFYNDTPRGVEAALDIDQKYVGKTFIPKDVLPEVDAALKEAGKKVNDTSRAEMFKERFAGRRAVPKDMLPAIDELIRKHGDTPTPDLRARIYNEMVPPAVQKTRGSGALIELPGEGAPMIPASAIPSPPSPRTAPADMPFFQPPTQNTEPAPINFSQEYMEPQPP